MTDSSLLTDPLYPLAHKLVEEAMAKLPDALCPQEKMVIRTRMLCDLLANPEGRLRLRRCMADPAVDNSQEQHNRAANSPADSAGVEEEPALVKEGGSTA